MFIAYLPNNTPPFDLPPPGSRVRLQGVFKEKMDAVLDYDQAASEFEMYLSSPDDMTVLQRPSWWSIRHTFWVLGGLGVVLLFSMIWVRLLRKQVRQRTQELSAEIEQRKRVEAQVEKAHKELVLISRQAGMAEVATTVLHNVGNVLNSVNVSASVVTDQVNRSHAGKVARVADLMREHTADLGQFLTTDPRGQHMPDYVARLGEHLAKEQKDILAELNSLNNNINHIKEIVATQQSYAKVMCVTESVKVTDLIEDVLRMNEGLWARHAVRLTREFDRDLTLIIVDKHQVMQIITNLLRNAKHACDDSGRADKQITIRARHDGQRVKISVTDNGIGILPENLPSIFNQGFTTRKDGHGFGLHSGALAAKNLGGALTVQSDGMNLGATFTLVLKQANWESERP
jgi:signal transduction histidine kinase